MRRRLFRDAALSLALLAAPVTVRAQSAIIYGSLGNFDISNDTEQVCHGFEIEIGGVTSVDVQGGFSAERYGPPSVVPYAGGVHVRWESPYDSNSQSFVERTLPHTVPWFPGQCYQWNPATYQNSGCEHFGSWTNANASHVTSRWLCEDNAHPGVLVPNDPPTAIPMPNYYVVPPVQAGDPPQLEVEIDAPEPAEAPELYGDAQWMRVYVIELPREVALEELVADNPAVVPMDPAQLESDWDIIQAEPACGGGGGGCQNRGRGQKHGSGNIEPTTRSIVRRIELYAFTGDYDPITHEALCADLSCSAPSEGEVGELISTQMTAVNVQSNSVDVTKAGNGSVDSDDTLIKCGNECVASYDEGTQVTLTAKPASNAAFAGWLGACTGTEATCSVPANGHVEIYATFVSTGGGSGTRRCGLLGIEGLLPFAWFGLRRWSQRS
jgi:hypothetical protein